MGARRGAGAVPREGTAMRLVAATARRIRWAMDWQRRRPERSCLGSGHWLVLSRTHGLRMRHGRERQLGFSYGRASPGQYKKVHMNYEVTSWPLDRWASGGYVRAPLDCTDFRKII